MAPVWSYEQPADTEVYQVAEQVKSDAKSRIQTLEQIFVAKTYREQHQPFMLGKLLLIKMDIGVPSNFVHMEVFVPTVKPAVLVAIQENCSDCHQLEPLV